jgi:hypothetical protein
VSTSYQRAIERMDAAARAVASDSPTKVDAMMQATDSERLIKVADGVELTEFEFFAGGPKAKESLEALSKAIDKLDDFLFDAEAPFAEQKFNVDPDIAPALRLVSENVNDFAERCGMWHSAAAIRQEIGLQEIAAANARISVVGHPNMSDREASALAGDLCRLCRAGVTALGNARQRVANKFAAVETRQLQSQVVDFLKRAAAGDLERNVDQLDVHAIHKAADDWIDYHSAGAAGEEHHKRFAAVLAHYFRLATGKPVVAPESPDD